MVNNLVTPIDLEMDMCIADKYKSKAQKIRVISENWVSRYIFCPCCGEPKLIHFPNNRPVADFYCPACQEEFELKSKSGHISSTIADGAYETMISRIQATNNPHFFFMSYNKKELRVQDLLLVPKYFFVAEIIEKRKPLASTARRAGWVGCNISLKKIPETGKIHLLKDGKLIPVNKVVEKYQKTSFAAGYRSDMRGWLLDILNCIERIDGQMFSLKAAYTFVDELQMKHPDNHHIKEKIRQQLQVLRDHNLIEFCGNGYYRKMF